MDSEKPYRNGVIAVIREARKHAQDIDLYIASKLRAY